MLARGIHRTVVGFLLVALLLGGIAGAALHAGGAGHAGFVCAGLAALFAIWPLAWVATARIAWPLRELAAAASALHGGQLGRRDALPETGGEVGEVAGALRALAERLEKQLRDQRALLAAVSHELRSPLGRARVLVEMSREGSAPASLHDDLQAEIEAMDGLVADLLAAARIDFEAVSPRVLDAVDVARRALAIAGLPADALVESEAGPVWADPTLLARALALLLDNARRYGGDHVVLHLRGRVGVVRFEVQDDGPGFAPGDAERAFQPFWRATGEAARGAARGRPPGQGLGLALVRQIAEAHGGEAGAENRRAPGDTPDATPRGALVWMELPREGPE